MHTYAYLVQFIQNISILGEADYSEEEIGKYEGDILGLSTMYKIGSKPDLVMKSEGQAGEYKVVDDYSGVSNEKPNLVFAKSESLADEEGKKKRFQNYIKNP